MTHEELVKEVFDRVQARILQAEVASPQVADLSTQRFISLSKIRTAYLDGCKTVRLCPSATVTDEAMAYIKRNEIVVEK